jgi:mono/diheme cytochrome c family protein
MRTLSLLPALVLSLTVACDKPPAETTPPTEPSPATGPAPEPAPEPAGPTAEELAAQEAEKQAAEAKAKLDEQIAQGKELYGANCAGCHGANGEGRGKTPKVVGEGALPQKPPKGAKTRKAEFNTAADVATFVVASMPPKKGGSLTPEQYYAILAFDLSANGIALTEPVTADNAGNIALAAPAAPAAEGEAPAK